MICKQTVKKFCKDFEKIENYDKAIADTTQTWVCHHRMELIDTGAIVNSSKQDLIDWGIYYNRPPEELVFMTITEHRVLHCKNQSDETKAKISNSLRGRKRIFSDEWKSNISSAMKGKSNHKGKHWKIVEGKRCYY